MLLVRDVRPGDLDELLEVARHLDSVNLPADRGVLAELIERSRGSFRRDLAEAGAPYAAPARGEYFVS